MTEECPYCKKVGGHECNCFAPAQDILQDDLAKRLRSNYHPEYEGDCLLCEAADRIEQLEAERDRLREALREIAKPRMSGTIHQRIARTALDGGKNE